MQPNKMRSFRLLGLKRNLPGRQAGIEIFVPDEAFFALHSLSYGVRKRQNLPRRQVWDNPVVNSGCSQL